MQGDEPTSKGILDTLVLSGSRGGHIFLAPDLPVDRQYRIATGIQYDWKENVTIGEAYQYLDAGDADINTRKAGLFRAPSKVNTTPTYPILWPLI